MQWLVKNAISRDVERQHLNKILQEIRSTIDTINSKLAENSRGQGTPVTVAVLTSGRQTGINVVYNTTSNAIDFTVNDFTIQLSGDITGTGLVQGLSNVNITTTLAPGLRGIGEAPTDGFRYWRYLADWERVPESLIFPPPLLPEDVPNPYAIYMVDENGDYIVDENGSYMVSDTGYPINPMFLPNHNRLNGIQGGAGDERYHLTEVQNLNVQGQVVSVFEFIPEAEIPAIKDKTSTYDVSAELQAAFDSGARSIRLDDGLFNVSTGLTITGKTTFSLVSEGAVINLTGTIVGLTVSGCDSFLASGDLTFTGSATATGIVVSSNLNSRLSGIRSTGLAIGGVFEQPDTKSYGGISVPDQTRIDDYAAIGCEVGALVEGEYYEFVSPHVSGCTSYGFHVQGGNFSASGGSVNGNRIGFFIEGGVVANSDHGKISGCVINHNLAAGVYIKDTDYGFAVNDCQIWATIGDGTTNGQLTEAGQTTSFGVYLENCENLNITNNSIARNRVNVGIDGIVMSRIAPNTFDTDSTLTTSHVKEYGASHDVYGLNAQNVYGSGSVFNGTLSGGGTERIETLDNNLSQAVDVGGTFGITGTNYEYVNSGVSGTYIYRGKASTLVIDSDTPATVEVSPVLRQKDFRINFNSISGATFSITVLNALSLVSQTGGAVVSGTTVTFNTTGTYVFSAYGNAAWRITCESGNQSVVTPTLINSWANLGGGFVGAGYWKDSNGDVVLTGVLSVAGTSGTAAFNLPTGFRPAAHQALPLAMDAGKSGFLRVNTNGDVIPNYEAAATFVSLCGVRFRIN